VEKQPSSDLLSRMRLDFAEAQRSKAQLKDELKAKTDEFEKLKEKSRRDNRELSNVSVERTNLVKRMRDRDEELKGKTKLLSVCGV
jgi:predicted  nucleic acid-binding Zn-ribbon protein